MRRSPAYIETPQIRLPPAVNISHQNIRGVHSEHTQNFIYPSLKCKWPIHTKLLAPNDLISLSYRTQYCVRNDNVYYELKKKFDWNISVLPDQCSRTFWAFSRTQWGGRYGCNNGRYGCTIVMSYIEINKAVSQWLLTFNLCVSVTWPLTCAFHIPCTHTPEITDMHRGGCDKWLELDLLLFILFFAIEDPTLPATGEEYFVWGASIMYFWVAGVICRVSGNIQCLCVGWYG